MCGIQEKRKDAHYCSNYRKRTRNCSHHYITTEVFEQIILNSLKEVSNYVRENEQEFLNLVMDNQSITHNKNLVKHKKKLTSMRKRYNELDGIMKKIYEDNVIGKLNDKRFQKLSDEYESEQESLEKQISELENDVENLDKQLVNTDKFIDLVARYTDFSELTTSMLNEFIEKVVVHEKVRGYRYTLTQDVEVYFNFIGRFQIPSYDDEETEILIPLKNAYISTFGGKKYQKFIDFMHVQEDEFIELPFAKIEEIIGFKLGTAFIDNTNTWYAGQGRTLGNIIYLSGYDIKKSTLIGNI